jgi:hypothetical protein
MPERKHRRRKTAPAYGDLATLQHTFHRGDPGREPDRQRGRLRRELTKVLRRSLRAILESPSPHHCGLHPARAARQTAARTSSVTLMSGPNRTSLEVAEPRLQALLRLDTMCKAVGKVDSYAGHPNERPEGVAFAQLTQLGPSRLHERRRLPTGSSLSAR